ncbi:DUF6054 family protein [Intestinimonas sp.]|uniref:DUF6054 family protein n=1 Tax=Intestinimonas sp. TaxID=1965293 RepID=UPI0029429786|nr:DUF6054 family protein [uncultured Intestinimonas sp.]
MAKLERHLTGDFDAFLEHLHRGLLNGSASASYEDGSDHRSAGGLRCAVRVYERYSMIGGNRVSLNLTLVGEGRDLFLSAITSGGSQAVIFKINTLGEGAFLDCVAELLDSWRPEPDPIGNEGTTEERRPCPCCGNYTLSTPLGSYELCPVCCWTDDPWASERPEEIGDYNAVPLKTARRNYQMFNACTEELRSQARPPEPEELPEVYSHIHGTDS